MVEQTKFKIPTFGKQESNQNVANAIDVLRGQGLFPKAANFKSVLQKGDSQLLYLHTVYSRKKSKK